MATIVHFDLPVDDIERGKKFYEDLFDWRFQSVPMPEPYYLIETADSKGAPGVGGGMGKRGEPGQRITNYIGVESVDDMAVKVESRGGQVIQPKMTVPGWGYLAVCQDTEGNLFGLWQDDKEAKN